MVSFDDRQRIYGSQSPQPMRQNRMVRELCADQERLERVLW